MLVLESLVGLHRTVQPQLLQHYWLGIDLDYGAIAWFAFEMNRDYSVFFEVAPSTAFWTLLLTLMLGQLLYCHRGTLVLAPCPPAPSFPDEHLFSL